MARTLEVIKIGKIALFSREGVTSGSSEENEIIQLQGKVSSMVREVKSSKQTKAQADELVNSLVFIHGPRFSNLETSIRQLARAKWLEY